MNARLEALARQAFRFGGLLTGVIMLFAVVFAVTGQAPAALVVFPQAGFPQSLPPDVRILRWDDRTALVTSEETDYVTRLYEAGAFLVLPYRTNGCLALQPPLSPTGAPWSPVRR